MINVSWSQYFHHEIYCPNATAVNFEHLGDETQRESKRHSVRRNCFCERLEFDGIVGIGNREGVPLLNCSNLQKTSETFGFPVTSCNQRRTGNSVDSCFSLKKRKSSLSSPCVPQAKTRTSFTHTSLIKWVSYCKFCKACKKRWKFI